MESVDSLLPAYLSAQKPLATLLVYGTLKMGQVNWPHWLGHAAVPLHQLYEQQQYGRKEAISMPRAILVGTAKTKQRLPFFTIPPTYISGDVKIHSSPCVLAHPVPDPPSGVEDSSPDGYRFTYPQQVEGELYLVYCPKLLAELDDLEGVSSGVYSRTMVPCEVDAAYHSSSDTTPIDVVACVYTRTTLYPARGVRDILNGQCGISNYGAGAVGSDMRGDGGDSGVVSEMDGKGKETFDISGGNSGSSSCHACFLSTFDVALSSRYCHYPTGYQYLLPHLRPSSKLIPGAFGGGSIDISPPPPIVLVLLDGVGDYTSYGRREEGGEVGSSGSCSLQGHLSPLQSASPLSALHKVAAKGVSGLMDPSRCGTACGSDTAHLSLLGYRPEWYYRGRGSFEAIGAGLDMRAGDIAFKCNFATIDEDGSTNGLAIEAGGGAATAAMPVVVRRRADRNFTAEGPVLCEVLNGTQVVVEDDGITRRPQTYTCLVQYATEHRCGIVIRGPNLSDEVTGTDPLIDGVALVSCQPKEDAIDVPRARLTSKVIMAVTRAIHEKLRVHPINTQRVSTGKAPANIVLLRGAALLQEGLPTFVELHGMRGFAVAPTCIIKGLSKCIGLDVKDVPPELGATGDIHSNVLAKAELAVRVLSAPTSIKDAYQFAFIHLKGVDDAGHEGNAPVKAALLSNEREGTAWTSPTSPPPPSTASQVLDYLFTHLPSGSTIVVTGDHTTPCALGDHSTEPVPVSMAKVGSGAPVDDDATVITEVESEMYGSLGRFEGSSLMRVVKQFHRGGTQ